MGRKIEFFLHYMYPDDKYGGLRKIKEGSTCCKDRDEKIKNLKEELLQKEEELKVWEQLVEDAEKTE